MATWVRIGIIAYLDLRSTWLQITSIDAVHIYLTTKSELLLGIRDAI